MIRPRWQAGSPNSQQRAWHRWDQVIAVVAATNLAWVIFDVTYIPLRNFWLQRNLYPLPSLPLVVPLPWLPDITPTYDKVKGIEPHRSTRIYAERFEALDRALQSSNPRTPAAVTLLNRQRQLTWELMETNPFVSSGNAAVLEKIKRRLRLRAGEESAHDAADRLLDPDYLVARSWTEERRFWRRQILPLVEINYWRSIDDSGRPTDLSWRIDLPFQLLLLLDIAFRTVRLRRRYPGIGWRDALLRRWLDVPLLLPFARLLRVFPVTERLSATGFIQLEPLRAVISQWVVALLALELFEVITVRVVDALQHIITSPDLPKRIRGFCSYQTRNPNERRELIELLRLWVPLLLTRIGPSLRPQLVELITHLLRRSLTEGKPAETVSRQLATTLVDSLLNLSKDAGNRLGTRDETLNVLGTEVLDRFWEELAHRLEDEDVMERSQALLVRMLEELKRSSFRQLRDQGGMAGLMRELDGLNFSSADALPRSRA